MRRDQQPPPDYDAAVKSAAVALREDRRFLGVRGRAPGEMLAGLLSNSLPPASERDETVIRGDVAYSTILTPKGRMISDLRVFRDDDEGFLLDLPASGVQRALAHFNKFLPPRLARIHDRSGELALLTLVGPEIPGLLGALGAELGSFSVEEMKELVEGAELVKELGGGAKVRLLGNGDLGAWAWDLLAPMGLIDRMRSRLESEGALPLSRATLKVLRVEAGRPAFGPDMDESTIPIEAGIQNRAIDGTKGCYTGQEVIIRIRDRGHVNRVLKGLLFQDPSVPPSGSELYHMGREKSIGRVTSSVWSPVFGGAAGLGYLRRGIEGGDVVQVGSHAGPGAQVRDLGDRGWVAP